MVGLPREHLVYRAHMYKPTPNTHTPLVTMLTSIWLNMRSSFFSAGKLSMLRGGGTLGVAESNEDRPPGGRVERHDDDTSMAPFAST